MRIWLIERHSAQVRKLRGVEKLNSELPRSEIVRPDGMRQLVFERHIRRLAFYETEIQKELRRGLYKWQKSRYGA